MKRLLSMVQRGLVRIGFQLVKWFGSSMEILTDKVIFINLEKTGWITERKWEGFSINFWSKSNQLTIYKDGELLVDMDNLQISELSVYNRGLSAKEVMMNTRAMLERNKSQQVTRGIESYYGLEDDCGEAPKKNKRKRK